MPGRHGDLTIRANGGFNSGPIRSREAARAPVAELVDALELKIEFRKECPFDSGQGHQLMMQVALFPGQGCGWPGDIRT